MRSDARLYRICMVAVCSALAGSATGQTIPAVASTATAIVVGTVNARTETPGSLTVLAQLWPKISSDPMSGFVARALRNMWRDGTPSSVGQLASLAGTFVASADLREAAVRALSSMHTREALPFLAGLLQSTDSGEKVRGAFGLSAFANGCPMQTNANVGNMGYLHCTQPTFYRTRDTLVNFVALRGSPAQETASVAFWQKWWVAHPELH